MKTYINIITVLSLAILFNSCSEDEGPSFSSSDLLITIDENPNQGTVLGIISTDLQGELSYTISNSALSFDPETLEVSVANELIFDYESNPIVIGQISLSNNQGSTISNIVINLNNIIDSIEPLLTTSKEAYNSANKGEWIGITKLEYMNLLNSLNNITTVGIDQNLYPTSSSGLSANFNPSYGLTHANETLATIPKNSFVFAIRFYVGPSNTSGTQGNKIKLSDLGLTEGYIDLGNPLPTSEPVSREVFFILKRSSIKTTNKAYLGMYTFNLNSLSYITNTVESSYLSAGDKSNLINEISGRQMTYQGLSTTQLQWD